MKTVVLDTETTSLNFKIAEVIEFGFVLKFKEEWGQFDELHQPSGPIDHEISAITNITDKMVAGKPSFADSLGDFDQILETVGTPDETIIVAHNAFYDKNIFTHGYPTSKVLDHEWVCTMRMAKKLYGNDDTVKKFNLAYLRYRFDLDVPEDIPAHRASSDAYVTAKLFEHLLDEAQAQGVFAPGIDKRQQLFEWMNGPAVFDTMPMGKHKGKKLTEVPMEYWTWALSNMDSLNEKKDEYDADFAASVVKALESLV